VKQAQVSMKVALKREIIQEKLDNMRGAVMMGAFITSPMLFTLPWIPSYPSTQHVQLI
jgi:hypothetical protein